MKKILLTLAVLGGVVLGSFAQSKSDGSGKFSLGLEAGLPIGSTSNGFSFVIGGSLKYDMPIADKTAFTVSAGYTSLIGKTMTSTLVGGGTISFKVPSAGFVPFKAGVKYWFADAFYGEAQAGAVFDTRSGGGVAFAYSPGIGYKFSDAVDLGIRYECWSHSGTVSQIGARLAYSF
jgi:hypothetical protein